MDNKNISYQTPCEVINVVSNDFYMTLISELFSTETNLNGVRVEQSFIDEICAHSEEYTWVPFCVDKRMLKSGHINSLGHKMDPNHTRFTTEQVGSFRRFWKEDRNGVTVLCAEIRIAKRDKHVCDMLQKLYDSGRLRVSFEIMTEHCRREGDAVVVDANPGNVLVGMAVVSVPAYPDASSPLLMVAENESAATDSLVEQAAEAVASEEEGENMNDEKMIPEEQVEVQPEEVKTEEPKPEQAEEIQPTETEEPKEEEQPEQKPEGEPEKEEPETEEETPAVEEPKEEEKQEEAQPQPAELPIPMAEPSEIIEDVAELQREIEELKAQIEMLMPYKLAAEEAECKAKQASMRAFAQKHGLNQEDEKVAAAIGAMDYQALMEMSMEAGEEDSEPQVQMASFTTIAQKDTRAFLYERGTYKQK